MTVPPQVLGGLEVPVRVLSGQPVRLECEVRGSPPPDVTWTIDDRDMALDDVLIDNKGLTIER